MSSSWLRRTRVPSPGMIHLRGFPTASAQAQDFVSASANGTVELNSLVFAHEDWDGSVFSLIFDASAEAINDTLDVDAGRLLGHALRDQIEIAKDGAYAHE